MWYNLDMITCAWLWIYAGAALMLLELVAPGFVLCFFGLSAATVGVLRFVLGEAFSPNWQLAAFSVFSVLYILVLRRYLKKVFVGGKVETKTDFDNESVGRTGKVVQAIQPPLTGQLAAFSVFSILYILILRRYLKRIFVGGKVETKTDFDNESVGRTGKVTSAIQPPLAGRVLLGDAEWTAEADSPIAVGANVRVVAQQNLTMKVEEV